MRRLNKLGKIVVSSLVVLFILITSIIIYNFNLGKVNNNDDIIVFEVANGSTYLSLASNLKEKKLIKSEFFYKLYIKLSNPSDLKVGRYELSQDMGVKEIVNILKGGSSYNPNTIKLTFKEGINMRKIVSLITENTNNKADDIYSLLKNEEYLNELINEYWFITEDIKNQDIYYSLEGYLFPNTYEFMNKDVNVKEIFKKMLDNMKLQLEPYKTEIENSKYNIHQLLTLASIIELEAANTSDRAKVAGVFYNRLKNNWSLGSDVTTYYAVGIDMNERDLYQSELNDYNAYNTRSSKMAGKLPVGPICIPSIESIKAVIEPENHNYFYFVADKHKKTYFSASASEHNKIVNKLKDEGLWFEY